MKNFSLVIAGVKDFFTAGGKLNGAFARHAAQSYTTLARRRLKLLSLVVLLGLCASQVPAMNFFTALGMIESGNNDAAIGAAGEVSRFQIMPEIWQDLAKLLPKDYELKFNPQNPRHSGAAVYLIMSERHYQFVKTHHRPASNYELYLLWSCPSRVDHPSKFKAEVAQRFANLCDADIGDGARGITPITVTGMIYNKN